MVGDADLDVAAGAPRRDLQLLGVAGVLDGIGEQIVQHLLHSMGIQLHLGGQVMVAPADVCNLEDMRAAVTTASARFGPVRAVIHAAGVVDDGPLMLKTPAAIEDVFAPKLHGTLVLDRLFPDGTLDWLVLFSST